MSDMSDGVRGPRSTDRRPSSRAHSPLRSRPALTNVHTQIVTRPSRSHTWEAQSLRTRHVTHRRPRGASTRRAPSAPARGLTHPSRGRRRRARHLRARPLPPLPATAVAPWPPAICPQRCLVGSKVASSPLDFPLSKEPLSDSVGTHPRTSAPLPTRGAQQVCEQRVDRAR